MKFIQKLSLDKKQLNINRIIFSFNRKQILIFAYLYKFKRIFGSLGYIVVNVYRESPLNLLQIKETSPGLE